MKSECDRALEADRNSRDELNKLRASKESKKGEDKKNEKLEDERNLKEVKIAEKQRWEEVLKVERKRWAEISQKRELEIKEEPKREKMIWEEEKRHGQKLVLDLEEKISGGQVLILKVEEGKELGRTLISNLQGDVRDKSRMLLELRTKWRGRLTRHRRCGWGRCALAELPAHPQISSEAPSTPPHSYRHWRCQQSL